MFPLLVKLSVHSGNSITDFFLVVSDEFLCFPRHQARAGRSSAVDALKVTEAFANEDDYTVWSDLCGSLSSVAVLLQYTDAYPQYKAYARKLFSTIAATVGWDPKRDEGRVYICFELWSLHR